MKKDSLPHGEICINCAIERKGIPVDYPVTWWSGKCPYCDKETSLTSITDFNWPDRKAIWD